MDLLSSLLTETYYLFNYTLAESGEEGARKSRTCGQDFTIDEAFSVARTLVHQDHLILMETLAHEGGVEDHQVRIEETEFGYDLVHNHRVVSRYWIHPKRVFTT
jgi:hypothetical protein